MDMKLNINQLDYLCEKYLLDNYNKFLKENNLKHSKEMLDKFVIEFMNFKN